MELRQVPGRSVVWRHTHSHASPGHDRKTFCFFSNQYQETLPRLVVVFLNVNRDKRKKKTLERDDMRNILNATDYRICIAIHLFVCINNPGFIVPLWSFVSNSLLMLYIIHLSKTLFKILFFPPKYTSIILKPRNLLQYIWIIYCITFYAQNNMKL